MSKVHSLHQIEFNLM